MSTESVLGAQAQNHAAHSIPVFLVAYYLTKNFFAVPDLPAESIYTEDFQLDCWDFYVAKQ